MLGGSLESKEMVGPATYRGKIYQTQFAESSRIACKAGSALMSMPAGTPYGWTGSIEAAESICRSIVIYSCSKYG